MKYQIVFLILICIVNASSGLSKRVLPPNRAQNNFDLWEQYDIREKLEMFGIMAYTELLEILLGKYLPDENYDGYRRVSPLLHFGISYFVYAIFALLLDTRVQFWQVSLLGLINLYVKDTYGARLNRGGGRLE